MAATSHPLASQAAIDVLVDGGTAVDAAISANAVLGVVEPTGCGVGGDLFAIVWDPAEGRPVGLNASGRAPLASSLDALLLSLGDLREIPLEGPWGVTVPGCVDGWSELHTRFGRLDMHRLLEPAIRAAFDGFQMTPVIAAEWDEDVRRIQAAAGLIRDIEPFLEAFAPLGRAPRAGELHANPRLGRTLRSIATGGRCAFYEGATAERIVDSVRRRGGTLAPEDLSRQHAEWVVPLRASYRDYDVFEMPPNSQGITALQMLLLVEPVSLSTHGFGSADALHVLIESKKLAFEDRARFIADPDRSDSPIEALLAPERLAIMRSRIDPSSARRTADIRLPLHQTGDTCYLTTADRDGMMVSLIQSNFMKTGSGIVPDGLGFALQNRGALFALDADHANAFEPGKRPFHTIIPALVLSDGRPILSFGVMGGDMQPQGHVQILTDLLDFGMTVKEAGAAPRWRHTGSSSPGGSVSEDSGVVLHESGFDARVLENLRRRGHRLEERTEGSLFGGYQAIAVDTESGDYFGASEPRKDGIALGL